MLRVAWWLALGWAALFAVHAGWLALRIPLCSEIVSELICYCLPLAVVAVLARHDLGAHWTELVPLRGMPAGLVIPISIMSAGLWGVSVQTVSFLTALNVLPGNAIGAPDTAGAPLLQDLVLSAILPALFEEAIFRGVVLQALTFKMSERRALVISALFFATFHFGIERMADTFLAGMVFGWLYLRTRSLLPGMLAHFLHNAICVACAHAEIGRLWDPGIRLGEYQLLPAWFVCLSAAVAFIGLAAIRRIPARRVAPAEVY